jgi:hypothetical protein
MTPVGSRIKASWQSALFLTLRASSPEVNLGLFDFETETYARFQAWRSAQHTVNVLDLAANLTDEVMMIVIDAVFVPCGRTDRLNSSKESLFNQNIQRVIDRLSGDGSDA